MNTVVIEGEVRKDLGKKGTKQVRYANKIPSILYGGGNTVHFSITYNQLKPLITDPDLQIAQIEVEGKSYNCLLKDVQYHPVTDEPLHVDFQELVDDRKVLVQVPVKLTGFAVGVKAGGKLMLKARKLKIKTLPKYLVPSITMDVTNLEVGKSSRVKEIEIEGIEFMHHPNTPVASVEITRALRAAQAAQAKEANS